MTTIDLAPTQSEAPAIATLGALRESGYAPRSVREEMRANLIAKIRKGDNLFPGVVGYEQTVIPQIENAILSGQDIIFLGERGQAKTRLARSLTQSARRVDPDRRRLGDQRRSVRPDLAICAIDLVAEAGDDTPIEWVARDRRYGEKLATPDTTIADLIGEVDPIKVAEGRYLSDELTISYGLIPRTNRGIFTLNELPDLAERIQVGLLNIMEERDVQIRGYKIRLPLDVFVVASANPEDYTNRGRIITPLKDRYGSQIRTHYPETIELEIEIMEQERSIFATDGIDVTVPAVHEGDRRRADPPGAALARCLAALRRLGAHERRPTTRTWSRTRLAARSGSASARPLRASPTSLPCTSSTTGKIELETLGEVREEQIVDKLHRRARSSRRSTATSRCAQFDRLVQAFENGLDGRGVGADAGDGLRPSAQPSRRDARKRSTSSVSAAIRPRWPRRSSSCSKGCTSIAS